MDYFAALTAFVEAAKHRNFTRAAERLGVKASTISRYVSDLERDLGIALFNRTTRALKLTEGGSIFLLHSHKVLEDLAIARSAASSLNQEPRGLLRLHAPPAFTKHHIVPALNDFRAKFPEVRIDLRSDSPQTSLIDAGADLAIRFGHLIDSTLKARKIADEQWVLCAAPSIAAELCRPQHPKRLSGIEFISDKSVVELYWSRCGEHIHQQHDVQVRVEDLEAQMGAALIGLGAVLLPTWLAGDAIRKGQLVRVLEQWTCSPTVEANALWFIYPPKRIVSSKVRSFIDFMVARVSTPPYWKL